MKKKYTKPAILLLFIILATFVARTTEIQQYWNKEVISERISSLGIYGPIFFIFLYFTGTIFLFPGTPLTISSGVLFGAVYGTTYTVIGATLGASIAFWISRFFGKDFVDKLLKNKFKKLQNYDNKLEKEGLYTTLFLRLVPLFPFNGLNFALGLTKMNFKHFFLGTVVGIIPGSFVLANIGASATDIRSPKFYAFITIFILMAFVPHVYKKLFKRNA